MPDIDPAALSRSDSIAPSIPNALNISKINGATGPSSIKTQKTTNPPQRIDLEPLYTNLKAAIADNWGKYKEAISLFILGISANHLCIAFANPRCLRQAISIKTSFPYKSTTMSARTPIRNTFTTNLLLLSTATSCEMSLTKGLRPGCPQTTSQRCFPNP